MNFQSLALKLSFFALIGFAATGCTTPTFRETTPSRVPAQAEAKPDAQQSARLQSPCSKKPSPLFQTDETIDLKIKGSFPVWLNRSGSGQIVTTDLANGTKGPARAIPVELKGRGKTRPGSCPFTPIRIIWDDEEARKGTAFEKIKGQDMKLVVHCEYTSGTINENREKNEALLREYAVYQLLKSAGFTAFETRLAKIQYQNKSGDDVVEGYGFFVEPSPAMAKRCNLDHVKSSEMNTPIAGADKTLYLRYLLARLFADAADFDVSIGHNTEIFSGEYYRAREFVPYDFNDSGLVHARKFAISFAEPGRWMVGLMSGPVDRGLRPIELNSDEQSRWQKEFAELVPRILANQDKVLARLATLPMLEPSREAFRNHFANYYRDLRATYDMFQTGLKSKQSP